MNSVILQTATRFLMPLILVFSVVIMLQGHNKPGGGFIGGLLAAAAFSLHALAFNPAETRASLRFDLRSIIAIGLLISLSAGLPALLTGQPLFTGLWHEMMVPGIGVVHLGTPLLFDLGVYIVVIGISVLMVLTLVED
ncbi:MAG: Na+/H+ antiporter subunit B [Phycisphaeraceae bacterium]|nr:Na+/H+ antiporter subunit B [Phycisphaeraceae bacterium]MBX3368160.1 Na+/H+ antiporter subunit B [Phycisphaeraceae bacterium]QYK47833.1 MAG: Na+/H+ antiporter subunit B [Phycisphaeraceae bacterium]